MYAIYILDSPSFSSDGHAVLLSHQTTNVASNPVIPTAITTGISIPFTSVIPVSSTECTPMLSGKRSEPALLSSQLLEITNVVSNPVTTIEITCISTPITSVEPAMSLSTISSSLLSPPVLQGLSHAILQYVTYFA